MKLYTLSDNNDTYIGMRLAGIEGEIVHTAEETEAALKRLINEQDIAVILMTEKLINLCPELVKRLKLTRKLPLITSVPDRHGKGDASVLIDKYLKESIGMSFE